MDEALVEYLQLRSDATLVSGPDGSLQLRADRFQVSLTDLSIGRTAILHRLAEGWLSDLELTRVVASLEGPGSVLAGQLLTVRLTQYRWMQRRLALGQRTLLDIVPVGLGSGAQPPNRTHRVDEQYVLSRFCVLHREGNDLIARHPRAPVNLRLPGSELPGFLASASEPFSVADLAKFLDVQTAVAGRLLDEMISAQVVLDTSEQIAEDQQAPYSAWTPFELLVQERARGGRHVMPLGGTYRLADFGEPEPVLHEYPQAEQIDLPQPDLEAIAAADPTLTDVVNRRASIREHDAAAPITLAQLAEFLYRVQRVTMVAEPAGGGQQVARRPYPSGGSIAELEIYPVVSRCAGLEPGVYHYQSTDHRLERLSADGPEVRRVLGFAQSTAGFDEQPQVCLVITGRTQRLMWKYEGLGYTLLLKHAGVLTELMYLVATAMNLAPCAIGSGDGAGFERVAGIDGVIEPSIAEFLLGSRPPVAATSPAAATAADPAVPEGAGAREIAGAS